MITETEEEVKVKNNEIGIEENDTAGPQVLNQSITTNKINEDHINFADKLVISLSGGLDSTCLLMYMLSKGIRHVKAISFDYGQKHVVELKRVKKNIKFLQENGIDITHQIINMKDAFSDSSSSLHQGGEDIPEGDYREESMKSTVVENRNVIFGSIVFGKALGWANKTNSNVLISLGLHSGDHFLYPDCRPESQQLAEKLFKISNFNSDRVDYIAPFEYIDKAHVLKAGVEAMKEIGFNTSNIRKVLRNTNTCYNPNEKGEACGKCGSCTERIEAFAKNHIKDPIKYQIDIDWKSEFKKYKKI